MAKKLFETKNKKENNELVKLIRVRWSNLKDEIEKISEEEIEIEKPDKILKIVEKILNFNKKIQTKSGEGLKILTTAQMLSILPITLAQLKAGNNYEKLKNEIRQLLYSLYKSKKILQINSIKFDRYYLQMKTIFMNSENSKTNVPHTFKLN